MSVHRDLKDLGLTSPKASRRTLLGAPLVEAALARLGQRRFSVDEQATIIRAVARPEEVEWPHWWVVRPAPRASKKEANANA